MTRKNEMSTTVPVPNYGTGDGINPAAHLRGEIKRQWPSATNVEVTNSAVLTDDECWFELSGAGTIVYEVGSRIADEELWLLTRAAATLPFVVGAATEGARGRGRIWLNDRPRGSGLAFSGAAGERVGFLPDPTFTLSRGYRDLRAGEYPPWEVRRGAIFWRGYATSWPTPTRIDEIERVTMCRAVAGDARFDAGITGIDPEIEGATEVAGIARRAVDLGEFAWYRWVIDVDGASCSWAGLFSKLLFGCCVLKVESDQRQWYFDELRAWEHYVPVESVFQLRAMGEECRRHAGDCERIAARGRELALEISYKRGIEAGVAAVRKEIERARGVKPGPFSSR